MNVHTRTLVQSATLHYSGFVISWTAFKAELNHFKARQVWEGRQREREKKKSSRNYWRWTTTVPQFSKCSLCNPLEIWDYSHQQYGEPINVGQAPSLSICTSYCHEIQHQTNTPWPFLIRFVDIMCDCSTWRDQRVFSRLPFSCWMPNHTSLIWYFKSR